MGLADQRWEFLTVGDTDFLVAMVPYDNGVMAGVLVAAVQLQEMLGNFDVGPGGGFFLADSEGRLRSPGDFPPARSEAFRRAAVVSEGVIQGVRHEGRSYIVISHRSQEADLHFALVTTRSHLLKNLPFFQKMMYFWIPLATAVLLALYLGFLQRVMFRPLARLIQGMRQIGQGNFQIRLPVGPENNEFSFVSGTFNRMAEQIEKLKIDVYEEQLRLQEAEYRHLQIQINPHFYMNSLNIIYNLAALKDYRAVQKLSLHLAEYFRFLMLSHRTVVRLEDEIRHIRHYLEIQKMRYVSKLEYEIHVDPAHGAVPVSPLILQPFVENSVIHGFGGRKPDGGPFRIVIRSEDDPETTRTARSRGGAGCWRTAAASSALAPRTSTAGCPATWARRRRWGASRKRCRGCSSWKAPIWSAGKRSSTRRSTGRRRRTRPEAAPRFP